MENQEWVNGKMGKGSNGLIKTEQRTYISNFIYYISNKFILEYILI